MYILNAQRLLKPGTGIIGVTDFTVTPDQSTLSKQFWFGTFHRDHVYLNPHHLSTLQEEFDEVESDYGYGTLPYTPFFLKPAYYYFIGRRAGGPVKSTI